MKGLQVALVPALFKGQEHRKCRELARLLVRAGHTVHLLTEHPLEGLPEGVHLHLLQGGDPPLLEGTLRHYSIIGTLLEVHHQRPLDVVYVHDVFPWLPSVMHAREVAGAAWRVVGGVRHTDMTLLHQHPALRLVLRHSLLTASHLTALSNNLAANTRVLFNLPEEHPIEVIPSGVHLDNHLYTEGPVWRKPVVLHTTNHRPVKRTGDVLRAFQKVRLQVDAELLVVGDGPDRSQHEALARQLDLRHHVTFMNPRRDLTPLWTRTAVVMKASEYEAFPLDALRAQACGIPVVATRVGGIPEVLQDGHGARLLEVGDVDGLAQAALGWLLDEKGMKEARWQARHNSLRFSHHRTLERHLDALLGGVALKGNR